MTEPKAPSGTSAETKAEGGLHAPTRHPIAWRDPEFYENPNEVRLDRRPTHVTLGYGIHRCLGQHLARRELQTAIEEFVKVIPEFKVQPGHKVKFHCGNIIHIQELPLTWN